MPIPSCLLALPPPPLHPSPDNPAAIFRRPASPLSPVHPTLSPTARRNPKSRPRSYRNDKQGYTGCIATRDTMTCQRSSTAYANIFALCMPKHGAWRVEARERERESARHRPTIKRVQTFKQKESARKDKKRKKKSNRDQRTSFEPKTKKNVDIQQNIRIYRDGVRVTFARRGVPVPCQAATPPSPPPRSRKASNKKSCTKLQQHPSLYLSVCASSSSSRSGRPSSSLSACADRRQVSRERGVKNGSKGQRSIQEQR